MLNPDAPEYVPISQSILGLPLPSASASATETAAGFSVSPPLAVLPPPFPCLPVPILPQVLIYQSVSCGFFSSSSSLIPSPPGVAQISNFDQPGSVISFAISEKVELFPRVKTGKKFLPSKHRRSYSSSECGGFWSGYTDKRLGRRSRGMSAVGRGRKPKESFHLKKHGFLPLKHDDEKTTVMIKNIPNEFTRLNLMEFLDKHCMSENRDGERSQEEGEIPNPTAYDFLYLPIDFQKKRNKGYAFVNFTESSFVWKFFNAFNETTWEFSNSPKIRRIVCARIQGNKALVDHFKKTYFGYESEEFLPAFFSPPRDGSGATVNLTTIGRRGSEGHHPHRNPLSLDHHHS